MNGFGVGTGLYSHLTGPLSSPKAGRTNCAYTAAPSATPSWGT